MTYGRLMPGEGFGWEGRETRTGQGMLSSLNARADMSRKGSSLCPDKSDQASKEISASSCGV